VSCGNTHTPDTQQQAAQTAQPPPLPASVVAPAMLGWMRSNLKNAIGKVGEQIAAAAVANEFTVSAKVSDKKHGVDVKASDPRSEGLKDVNVEVKTSTDSTKTFSQLLKTHGDVGRQASEAWHASRGEDPSAPVMGVHVNLETETLSIFVRADAEAREWNPVVTEAPLWLYEELQGDA
jgi:hypothetical protein